MAYPQPLDEAAQNIDQHDCRDLVPTQRHSDNDVQRAPFTCERFEQEWPAIEGWIVRSLARRGCASADCDDIAQETAARMLIKQVPFDDGADLARYALAVAMNLHRSDQRTSHPQIELSQADLLPGVADVTHTVECRLALQEALVAIRQLPQSEQALLQERLAHGDRCQTINENVKRHRLRKRLKLSIHAALPFG